MKQAGKNGTERRGVSPLISGFIPVWAGMLLCLLGVCSLFAPEDNQPLTMRCITPLDDTVSVFPRLQYVFSAPLADSSVSFSFIPPTSSRYEVFLNPARDTATLQIIDALAGLTRYVIRLTQPIVAVNGNRCAASDDSTVLFTYAFEQEPNDDDATADTFSSVIFGIIQDVEDIDVFLCATAGTRALCLESIDCQDSLYAVDAAGRSFTLSARIGQIDTLHFSDSIQLPVYAYVLSRVKGWAGKYRLGCIAR